MRAVITGTGMYIPEMRVDNDAMAKVLDTSDEWIRVRTGIEQRHYAAPDEATSDLAVPAARQAIADAGLEPSDIDYLVVATMTPDYYFPGSAPFIQRKLGLEQIPCLDIRQQCAGFVYAMQLTDALIRSGQHERVLVVGAEVLTQFVNWRDRTSCILFGDGAGAAVIEQVPAKTPQRLLSSHLLSNGALNDLFLIPAGGSSMEVTPDRYQQNLHKIQMNGREIFKVAVRTLVDCAQRTLAKHEMTTADLDWFVPHQANIRIIEAVAERLGFPMDRVLINVDRYGNTSAATIPTVLDEAIRSGRIQSGQTILFDAFGAGLTAGAILLRW